MSSLSCLLLIVAIANAVQGQVEVCGSDNFDVNTIKKQPYWTFRVPDARWCVGGEANINAECHASFSFCGPLPKGQCGRHNDTGFCQIVTDANIITSYDTGKSTTIVSEVEGYSGFQFAYRNGTNTSTCVNDTTATLIFFQCDPNAEWNIYDNNVTRFVESFLPNPEDPCLFLVTINYSGACVTQKPIFPKICQLDGYEVLTLTEPLAWVARVPSAHCYGLSRPEGACELLLSFCKELPSGQCYKSAFCQKGTGHTYSFGAFNEHFRINENDGHSGFTMIYNDGTHTANCPDGFFSTLVFTCDPNAVWTIDPTTDITNITQFITAAEPTFNNCEYIVRFIYCGACYSGPPCAPTVIPTTVIPATSTVIPTTVIPATSTVISTSLTPTGSSGGVSQHLLVRWISLESLFGVVIISLVVCVIIIFGIALATRHCSQKNKRRKQPYVRVSQNVSET